RPRRRARRPERRGQDHLAAAGHRTAHAHQRHDQRPRRASRRQPGAAGPGRLRRPGHAGLRPHAGRGSPPAGCLAQPRLGRRAGAAADRAGRPGPQAAGRIAVRRAARPARPHPGARQAARAPPPRRAGRQPGPARPPGVPAQPDGGGRRARHQRGAVLPSGYRPGTGLRLPCRARRLPGPHRRGGQRAARLPPPAVRPPPRPRHPPGGPGRHRTKPYRQAEHPAGPHRRPRPRPGLDRHAGQHGGTGPRLHEPGERYPGPQATARSGVMIRLTWLQFRIQAVTAVAALAVFAVLLAATGPHLASLYAADGLDSCHGGSSCANLATYFTASLARSPYGVLFLLSTGIILLAPAVIGLFWGAPLIARELETGTAALAWNQSVTRTRWLAVKLA